MVTHSKAIMNDEDAQKLKSFRHEMMSTLENHKQVLRIIIDDYPLIEEPSYHDTMMYATAKAFLNQPIYKQNIYLASQFIFKSSAEFAEYLNVSRPTLSKFLATIKKDIKTYVLSYIKRNNN